LNRQQHSERGGDLYNSASNRVIVNPVLQPLEYRMAI